MGLAAGGRLNPIVFIFPGAFLIPSGLASEEFSPSSAVAKISATRTGELVVKVTGRDGRPAAGCRVEVEMRRHQFLFGSNLFLFGHAGSEKDEETYRERFAGLFNYATLPFYWGGYEPERGKPQHDSRERAALWAREKGIAVKGHPLVWNHPASVPRWLPGELPEVRRLSRERVTDCAARFKGLIDVWDVVNEAVDPWRFPDAGGRKNLLTETLRSAGVEEMVLESFAAARAANPGARLIINDYRTDPNYRSLLEKLAKDGRPVYDIIGIQSHMHDGAWSPDRTWKVCEDFAGFGVPLHFTETTIVSGKRLGPGENWGPTEPELEERQAREVVRFYTVLFSHPAVEAITWWDFADRGAWQGAAAGFLRKDLTAKPAYDALRKLIHEDWWTRAAVQTDAAGVARVRAFFGDYRIAAGEGGAVKTVDVLHDRKKKTTEVVVRLDR